MCPILGYVTQLEDENARLRAENQDFMGRLFRLSGIESTSPTPPSDPGKEPVTTDMRVLMEREEETIQRRLADLRGYGPAEHKHWVETGTFLSDELASTDAN